MKPAGCGNCPQVSSSSSTSAAFPGPLRVGDFADHVRSMGLPQLRPPAPVSSFLAAPLRHQGAAVGNINVARSEPAQEFTREDEETLVMFASQAALVIANARRHRDELRARSDLETLIDTSPVGVVVFAPGHGNPGVLQPGGAEDPGRLCGPPAIPWSSSWRC